MLQLPSQFNIDTRTLSSIFDNTTNSYKYYWFLSILDGLKESQSNVLALEDLCMRMLEQVWYPLTYFNLSFGKHDSFRSIANAIKPFIDLSGNAPSLRMQLANHQEDRATGSIKSKVKILEDYVPYRFLRPFFYRELKGYKDYQVHGAIRAFTNQLFEAEPERVFYKFENDSIIINANWMEYLSGHQAILRGFIYWHLTEFLQGKNPNVPGISSKLVKPAFRDLHKATQFWKGYLETQPEFTCIYTGQAVAARGFTLDHFLPWSFVVHDLFWNLIPTPRSVNSQKSNGLPEWRYFSEFAQRQYTIFDFYRRRGNDRILQDYVISITPVADSISQATFTKRLEEVIYPQYMIARSMGFREAPLFTRNE